MTSFKKSKNLRRFGIFARLIFICLIIILSILNCKNNKSTIISPGNSNLIFNDTLTIMYKDTLFNYDENIWITFDSLMTDSRCAIGAECKWEGNAELLFIFKIIEKIGFTLNTHYSFRKDTTINNYTISLINVLPYPHKDSLYTASDYSAEIIIYK